MTETRFESELNHKLSRMSHMEAGLQYILDNLMTDDCTIEHAAEAAGYQPKYFRILFRDYFGVPFNRFVTQLKIWETARIIRSENFPKRLGERVGLSGPQSFSRAFRREMGVSPREFYLGAYDVPDFPMRECVEGIPIKVEYHRENALRIKAVPLIPPDGTETDLLREVAFAYKSGVMPAAAGIEEEQIGIWWFDPDENLYYCFGPVEERFDTSIVPRPGQRETLSDHVSVLIMGGNYAVFSYPRPERDEDIPYLSRIMCQYAFYEWVPINHVVPDTMGFTYERFTRDRVYLYMPLTFWKSGEGKLKRKEWAVPKWAELIDEHITEPLTLEKLARSVGYSPKNFRDVFSIYYNISPMTYVQKRRLYLTEKELGSCQTEDEERLILRRYGFDSREQFYEQNIKTFGHPPFTTETEEVSLTDLLEYYQLNKDSIECVIRTLKPKRYLMHVIKTSHNEEHPSDIPDLVVFWCGEEFEDFHIFESVMEGGPSNREKMFIWGEEPEMEDDEPVYRYRVGVALNASFRIEDWEDQIRETGAKLETIPGGRYAVFNMKEPDQAMDPREAYNRLTRCAFGGWIDENRFRVDMDRRTFVLWRKGGWYFHVPVLR